MLGHLILREYTGFFIGNPDKPWVKTRKIRSIKGPEIVGFGDTAKYQIF